MAEFASVMDAVQCAVVIQATLKAENATRQPELRMEFRIGVNLGDVAREQPNRLAVPEDAAREADGDVAGCSARDQRPSGGHWRPTTRFASIALLRTRHHEVPMMTLTHDITRGLDSLVARHGATRCKTLILQALMEPAVPGRESNRILVQVNAPNYHPLVGVFSVSSGGVIGALRAD